MKVFVTGFGGYVGSHAAAALQAKGASLTVLVRNPAGADRAERLGFKPAIADLGVPESLVGPVADADAVAHCAASDRPEFLAANGAAIAAMLSALKPGGVFLTHGGSMVFGEQGRDGPATTPGFAPPPMLQGRADLDRSILRASRADRRTFVVYGAFVFGGSGAMIPNALAQAARRTGFSGYPADGAAIWSGVHVEDWAELMALVILGNDPGGRPVFAAAQDVQIADAASILGAAFTPTKEARSVGADEARELWPFFAHALGLYQRFDRRDATDRFGWQPAVRDLRDAFVEALAATGP